MTNIILCDVTASVSELKNDPVPVRGAPRQCRRRLPGRDY